MYIYIYTHTREGNEEFAVGLQNEAGGDEGDAEGKGLAEVLKTSAAKHIYTI
jgi:hypothetical protein